MYYIVEQVVHKEMYVVDIDVVIGNHVDVNEAFLFIGVYLRW